MHHKKQISDEIAQKLGKQQETVGEKKLRTCFLIYEWITTVKKVVGSA